MNLEDGTRLEEFRQFRREVRGSSKYLLVGIDIAKETLCLLWHRPGKDAFQEIGI